MVPDRASFKLLSSLNKTPVTLGHFFTSFTQVKVTIAVRANNYICHCLLRTKLRWISDLTNNHRVLASVRASLLNDAFRHH